MMPSLFAIGLVVAAPTAPGALPDEAALKKMQARFAPADLVADVSQLPDNERQALRKLVQAARLMDSLFLRQVWSQNPRMLFDLAEDSTPLGKARLAYFTLNKGPWSRLDHDAAFVPGAPAKPAAASFYPADATKEEVEAWVKTLSEAERQKAGGFFTTVRRDAKGKLVAVPYNLEYQAELADAARLLREAAGLTTQPTLKAYLEARAAAFLSNDYYQSDVAWMELDASIEPTIGPYEVYEDQWFAQKAAFEAFITLRDDAETQKLGKLSAELQDLENNLPIDAPLRNPKLGAMAPIRVVSSIFSGGDGNRGVQTAAFNLPNDERVIKEKGSKRVMLKNVQEQKFKLVLQPIAKAALSSVDQKDVAFDAFFTHILMHELMHGLGPQSVSGSKKGTVRNALQEVHSAVEEAKADISGLWALQFLVDKGVLPAALGRTMYTTYLASCFRSIRFGINEAHGRGIALQLNSLLDAGAFKVAKDGTFSVEREKVKDAVKALTGKLMTLQANGDKAGATALLNQMAVIRPEVQKILDKVAKVPVDIQPRFVTATKLLAEPEK